jgi:hypothetical protein
MFLERDILGMSAAIETQRDIPDETFDGVGLGLLA